MRIIRRLTHIAVRPCLCAERNNVCANVSRNIKPYIVTRKMKVTPGLLRTADEKCHEYSVHSAVAKRQLKDVFIYCDTLLQEANIVDTEASATISADSMVIGEELYRATMEMLGEKILIIDNNLIHFDEVDQFCEVEENSSDIEDYEPVEKASKGDYIPLETKIKVVKLVEGYPKWSLRTLQIKGSRSLTRKDELKIWEENIKPGGSTIDKYSIIDSWIYDCFVESCQNYQQVTARNLQQWALAAEGQFQSEDFVFKPSLS
ncbi:uncharacterized protein LOC126108656 [Schistocerca cancellata]|uniref:uncharacterized protein LOC126108656 n=1 Tax=Schistocerca cancellata TaxID=274614 RepID=UPI00211794F9|nr:uncharacterized protein LOC126108656 [Schistocerca cancellata]